MRSSRSKLPLPVLLQPTALPVLSQARATILGQRRPSSSQTEALPISVSRRKGMHTHTHTHKRISKPHSHFFWSVFLQTHTRRFLTLRMTLNLQALQPGPRTASFFVNLAMTIGLLIFMLVMCILVLSVKVNAMTNPSDMMKYTYAGLLAGIVLLTLAIRGGFNQVAFHVSGPGSEMCEGLYEAQSSVLQR